MRLAIALLMVVAGGMAWLMLAWPLINVVETGRTPEYPDLLPRQYVFAPARVFDAALHAVNRLPRWTLVAYDESEGVIRAEATTRVLRFVDDVMIRVEACGPETCVHVRSASRVGKGDLGQNARNVRALLAELDHQLTRQEHQ